MEALLVEIIVRGEIVVHDYVATYWVVGDVGAYN